MLDKTVTVVSVNFETIPVKLMKLAGSQKQQVQLGDQILGLAYRKVQYPDEVQVVRFTTSDGKSHCLANHRIPSFEVCWPEPVQKTSIWGRDGSPRKRRSYVKGQRHFAVREKLNGISIDFITAQKLKPGTVIERRQKYHLMSKTVSDGIREFPLCRPDGLEWKSHTQISFVKTINAVNWRVFLIAICGLYHEEILKEDLKKRVAAVKRQRRIQKTLKKKGLCFNGQGMQMVSIGTNLIFSGQLQSSEVFIVDSPEYGRALYIFGKYADALSWAERKIDHRLARELALQWLPHTKQWVQRVNQFLA